MIRLCSRHQRRLSLTALLAVVPLFAACETRGFSEAEVAEYTVQSLKGNGQTAITGTTLAETLLVSVERLGQRVGGAPIAWHVIKGGGTVTPIAGNSGLSGADPTKTDRDGGARAVWTLGPDQGDQQVVLTINGAPPDLSATENLQQARFRATAEVRRVASITLSPDSATAYPGETVTYQLAIRDQTGAALGGQNIQFFTSDVAVAQAGGGSTFDVTARAPGVARVIVRSGGQEGSAVLRVLARPVGRIAVLPDTATLAPGDTRQLEADVRDDRDTRLTDRAVEWVSANPAVATVSATGLVRAVAPGVVQIVARSEGKQAAAAVRVRGRAYLITPASATVTTPGGTQQFALAEVDDAGRVLSTVPNAQIIWTTGDAAVASINAAGLATCNLNRAGSTNVSAIITGVAGSITAFLTCVPPAAPAPTIAVLPRGLDLRVGQSSALAATITNAVASGTLVWRPRVPAVASTAARTENTVTVTGLAPGETYVDAIYTAGAVTVRDSALVRVTAAPASRVRAVVIEPVAPTITAPAALLFRAALFDASGARITAEPNGRLEFTSSGAAASIDAATGRATGRAAGQTTITARYLLDNALVASDATELTVREAGTAGSYGSVEISTGGNTREARVGRDVLFQVIVRDANGVQVTSGVTGLTVTSSDPTALEVAPDPGVGLPPGYFFRYRGLRVTAPGSADNPLANVPRVIATVGGARTELRIVVLP